MYTGGVEGYVCAGVLRGMCVCWGVEGDVCPGVLRGMCALGVLRGMCTYLCVCAGVVEGVVYLPMGVHWGC